jgi:hypothetical protein
MARSSLESKLKSATTKSPKSVSATGAFQFFHVLADLTWLHLVKLLEYISMPLKEIRIQGTTEPNFQFYVFNCLIPSHIVIQKYVSNRIV